MNNNNLEVNTFLQIIRITILNGTKYIKNTLLDTGSGMKLLKSDLAIKFGPNTDSKSLWITNAISNTSNIWVVSKLDINYQPTNVPKLKKYLDHLRNLDLHTLNLGGVPLLLGTNFQYLILHRDFSYIRKISPTISSQIIIRVGFYERKKSKQKLEFQL